jgi:hypothetical protein
MVVGLNLPFSSLQHVDKYCHHSLSPKSLAKMEEEVHLNDKHRGKSIRRSERSTFFLMDLYVEQTTDKPWTVWIDGLRDFTVGLQLHNNYFSCFIP